MWACENEIVISTVTSSLLFDLIDLFIKIIMMVGVDNMVLLNVVAVIGCTEENEQQI